MCIQPHHMYPPISGNLAVGFLADSLGRRVCMLVGWGMGALFCLSAALSPSWDGIVVSDLLLGLHSAFVWSLALFIAIDWMGPSLRAVAVGTVETVGYLAIAFASMLVGWMGEEGYVPLHFAHAGVCAFCLLLTYAMLKESRTIALDEQRALPPSPPAHPSHLDAECREKPMVALDEKKAASPSLRHPSAPRPAPAGIATLTFPSGRVEEVSLWRAVCAQVSCLDPSLMACCLVGLALNLATAYAWGAMSRWLSALALAPPSPSQPHPSQTTDVGVVLFAYSIPKGVLQLLVGILADLRPYGLGPREWVMVGLSIISLALAGLAVLTALPVTAKTAVSLATPLALLVGGGTAAAYSPVIACVVARADPSWRAAAAGTYRFWRDLGYAVGGLLLSFAVDGAEGAAWVAPLLASLFVLCSCMIFGMAYPREEGGEGGGGAEMSSAEMIAPASLLPSDAPRSEKV